MRVLDTPRGYAGLAEQSVPMFWDIAEKCTKGGAYCVMLVDECDQLWATPGPGDGGAEARATQIQLWKVFVVATPPWHSAFHSLNVFVNLCVYLSDKT